MVRQIFFSRALLLLGAMLPATIAQAQNQQPEPEKHNTTLHAVIQSIRPGFFQVETEAGDTWVCKIESPPANTTITGTADISWLRPGMYIRYSAGLKEERGGFSAVTPAVDLMIFSPEEGFRAGIVPEQQNAPDQNGDEGVNCFVSGQITGLRDGTLMVNAGGARVSIELDEDSVIKVDLNDLRFVRVGDKAVLGGYYYQQGQALINHVTIEAALPFGVSEEEAAQRAAEEEEAGEEEEGEGGDAEADEEVAEEDEN